MTTQPAMTDKPGQTRAQSAVEVFTNTVTGLLGSWVIATVSMRLIQDRTIAATVTVLGCTAWSLVRGWYIRRAFNRITK